MELKETCSPCDASFKGGRSFYSSHSVLVASFMVLCFLGMSAQASSDATKKWVGTWACAPYKAQANKPSFNFDNYTLRQIVRVSIGGDTVRVKFSNVTCANAVTIKSVNIAVSPDGTKSAIDASTIKKLTFNGDSTITMNAKSSATSDPVAFNLEPSMRLAITIYYGQCKSSDDMTFHYGSRTNSYYLNGEKTSSADFSGATAIERWFNLSNVDVLTSDTAAAVACLGNSITDGYGLSGGLQNRWTDVFSEKLLANPATQNVGVLNLGIGATCVTSASNGADAGVDRFEQDILGQQGVRWVIIFYGVNDINGGTTANNITGGFKKMITAAHAKNIKVYGATITPFNGHSYYSAAHEQVRSAVNNWIRTDTSLDGVIDFDKVISDPNDATKMQQALKNDWLHPNAAGYKVLGESVDPELFTLPPDTVKVMDFANHKVFAQGKIRVNHCKGTTMINFEIPNKAFVSLKVYSLLGKEIADLVGRNFSSGKHTIDFKNSGFAKGMYFYSLKVNNQSVNHIMIY